jgi:hypothetical protein
MQLEDVGEIIGTRTLRLVKQSAEPSEVLVLVGKPQRLPDHTDYYCPYQIEGVGTTKVRHMCGVDAFQALLLTLSALGVELEILNKELGNALSWECGSGGTFGFPEIDPASL